MKLNCNTICAVMLLLILVPGCGNRLPPDPGLYGENLGVGVSLGQPADQARDASAPQSVQLLVLTGEEFAGENPYDEREENGELLVAVYSPGSEQIARNGAFVMDPVVSIKVFPAAEGPSHLTLFGENLAEVTPAALVSRLGEPESTTNSGDGSTHLSYTFSAKQLRQRNIAAMFSYDSGGRCYALEISLTLLQ